MNFSEQPRSLTYRGEKFAEVWLKPEGAPCALIFRIPQNSFQIPEVAPQLTTENLLKAVAIAPEEVELWRYGDISHSGMDGSNPELRNPLLPPQEDVSHLEIYVNLKPPPLSRGARGKGEGETAGSEIPLEQWQELEARWKAILGIETTMDSLRISMEALVTEMEASLKKTLMLEEKLHALRADVASWNKAKNRVHHALPKLREFIHRSIWAIGSPERKQLEELYKNHIQPQVPFPQKMDRVLEQLEYLQKQRQVLSAHGMTVYHESKSIAASVQGTLRTLQSNAAANALKKKAAAGPRGKFMKQIRRWSGIE